MTAAVQQASAPAHDPPRCDFFQAVRLLNCAAPAAGGATPGNAAGANLPVRFAQSPTLAFSTATLAAILPATDVRPPTVVVNFFGLLGANGPMPLHWTELASDGGRRIPPDEGLAHFLDLFHDRLLSLYYRAWAQAQPAVALDSPPSDAFSRWVSSLAGIGLASLRDRDAMPDAAKRGALAVLASGRCSGDALAHTLRDLLRVPVDVRAWQPGWLPWPAGPEVGLGRGAIGLALADGAPIGRRVPGAACRIRIVLGPLSLADYRRFLPGGPGRQTVADVLQNLLGLALVGVLQCLLRAGERPALRLGRGDGARLGWLCWLGGREALARAAERTWDIRGPPAY